MVTNRPLHKDNTKFYIAEPKTPGFLQHKMTNVKIYGNQ